ncbi:hypothetical protein [Dactylosporangium sp. NPDC006015]|uniref:hypothetical protein n=1 Tax=Dactylosporangium sp. NPDC006015 TaxID=3154576 RepID=UPI0033B029F7
MDVDGEIGARTRRRRGLVTLAVWYVVAAVATVAAWLVCLVVSCGVLLLRSR